MEMNNPYPLPKNSFANEENAAANPLNISNNNEDAKYWAWEKRKEYKWHFPESTPLICACEKGHFEDVKVLIVGHDVDRSNMTLKEYVKQVGKENRRGFGGSGWCTPLEIAKDLDIINYLFGILLDGVTLNRSNVTDEYTQLFPKGTPLVSACEKGRLEDVKLFITGHGSDSNNNMTLKKMVNQVGKGSRGYEYTPLMAAARYEHFHVVQYLIEQGEADPNITGGHFGRNVLHYAALNEKDTDLIQFLLKHMSIDSINETTTGIVATPLDRAEKHNHSPIRQEIINLILSKGGKYSREICCGCGRFSFMCCIRQLARPGLNP